MTDTDKPADKLWHIESMPPFAQMDGTCRNDNIKAGKPLCGHCVGTGNELYSMYRKCPKCNGTGVEVTA